ncbi:hypothetical protein D3C80_1979440 [compost metagenome]
MPYSIQIIPVQKCLIAQIMLEQQRILIQRPNYSLQYHALSYPVMKGEQPLAS